MAICFLFHMKKFLTPLPYQLNGQSHISVRP
jgi:hypothetical protein